MAEFEVQLYEPGELASWRDAIWDMLVMADREFVPRLSARVSTTTLNLQQQSGFTGPLDYFEDVMTQYVLIARLADRVVGLSAFIPHYSEEMLAPYNPSTHVSTTIVKVTHRRQGIGAALNQAIEDLPSALASPFITRRTWSTNVSNMSLLEGIGFERIVQMPHHRGTGIDTIYYGRKTKPDSRHPEVPPSS